MSSFEEWVTHDAEHCIDYDERYCPSKCYRGWLTRMVKPGMVVSFAHLVGTELCELTKNNSESEGSDED